MRRDDPEQFTDQEVMRRVRDGDSAALRYLFDRYHRRLFAFCLRMTANRELAQDLVQDVFVRVLRYRDSYQPGRPVAPWIFRMARNASIDHLRKGGREVAPPEDGEDWVDPEPGPVPVERLQRREELGRLKQALDRLPEERREVLMMARFGEMKYAEIADCLDCSVGAVKVRVHRAMKQLREVFLEMTREAAS